jgi:hypothetical protein
LFGQVAAVRSGNALAVLDGFALIRLEAKMPNPSCKANCPVIFVRWVQRPASPLTPRPKGACCPVSGLAAARQLLPDGFCGYLQAIAKRLTMFVMRSRVKVTVLNGAETGLLGVRGAQLEAVIAQYFETGSKPACHADKMPMWPLHCLVAVSSSI